MPTETQQIRNIALLGSPGSGKTLLTEALLHHAGAIKEMGSIERGSTVSDWDTEEQRHGHSLNTAIVHCDLGDIHINLLDTPGHNDFLGQALSAMEAVETAAIVINSQTGIDSITRRMLQRTQERKLCCLIIINRIDQGGDNLSMLVDEIRRQFGEHCLPINLPSNSGKQVSDCFFTPDGDADFSSVTAAHTQIIDQVVEVDEDLMEVYLEQGQELSPEQLHAPFEQALREGHLIPICFTSAKSGAGISALADILTQLMPNPLEGTPPVFLRGEENPVRFEADFDPRKHLLAHTFKVTTDPFVGKMGIFRIYQGVVTKDSLLYVGDGRKTFKVGHLFRLQGKEHIEITQGIPGDICAVSKVDEIHFDSVLHDDDADDFVHLQPMLFPRPLYGLAIEPKSRNDDQKISKALAMLTEEDPTWTVEHSTTTNEVVIHGLGELHLRILLERMQSRYNIEVDTRPPRIAYRETITAPAEGHYRHKKQTGGSGQFGEVSLRIQPLPRGSGFRFTNKVVGGAIPGQFISAVEKGVKQIMTKGALAGFPMQDIEVTVYDGKHHSVDSKEIAFVTAGKKAFQMAIESAKSVLLEPLTEVDIETPEACLGDITRDISGMRGQILGTENRSDGTVCISGIVPLAELSDYALRLKSVTGGQGSFNMSFARYEIIPPNLQKQIISS